ncbi:ATP-dependent nuclease [Micromonospora sp. NPDC018662]|uniref:ATP-dependent nuclease n=1 Tax=Micromonospora sp. NPDC018662 TaxID=3364238 RepID=UPI0037B0934F
MAAQLRTVNGDTQRLSFSPGLTVLSGGNGAGKSTLLGALHRCLAGELADDSQSIPGVPPWLESIEVTLIRGGSETKFSSNFRPTDLSVGQSFEVFYIDPAAETEEILRQVRLDAQPRDLLEGVDPSPFAKSQVEYLSYVLRREYSEVLAYEITEFSSDDTPRPFFEVTSMMQRYSLLNMGRGELSAAYLIWKLWSLPPGSVVLLEEPENHLAAFSQPQLADMVIASIVERDLCMVVSTHSPGFFQRLPSKHVSLVSSLPTPQVASNLGTAEIASHLGLSPVVSAIALVEDRVGAMVLAELIAMLDSELVRYLEVRFVANGESGINKVLHEMAGQGGELVTFLGIYDGDQRGAVKDTGKIAYLIGDAAPEVVLRGAFSAWRAGGFSDWTPAFPGGASRLRLILERLDGRDLHDWVIELGREVGGLQAAVRAAVELALKDETLRGQAVGLVEWLRNKAVRL